jgi:hypothetical protein
LFFNLSNRKFAFLDDDAPFALQHLTIELSRRTFKMKHLAAYLLLQLGGNASPSAKDITAVLESVGIEADADRLKTLLAELKGKDVNEVRAHTGFGHRKDEEF